MPRDAYRAGERPGEAEVEHRIAELFKEDPDLLRGVLGVLRDARHFYGHPAARVQPGELLEAFERAYAQVMRR